MNENNINWENWDEEENTEFIFDLDNKIYPPFKNLKVNDRVEFINNNKSYFATIIRFLYRNDIDICLTFEFDDFIKGHNALNKGKEGHCWCLDDISIRDFDELRCRLRRI